MAREQTRDGAHLIDLNIDYVGRDGAADMAELAGRLATASTLPIMLDSTEPDVLRAGLERLGGRSIGQLGELRGRRRPRVALPADDGAGPRARCGRRRAVHRRGGPGPHRRVEGPDRGPADRDLTANHGMHVEDIVVDTLTFPITTGQEEVRRDALETIEAIRELKRRHPERADDAGHLERVVRAERRRPAGAELGVPARVRQRRARHRDRARQRRSSRWPRSPTSSARWRLTWSTTGAAPKLRRARPTTRCSRFMELFEGVTAAAAKAGRAEELAALPLFERLERRIVDGERNGLEADLDAALDERPALEIINDTLLSGMKTVGELFGSGQMQLPFVLQSAEVMKTAVAHLEPHMERSDAQGKGTHRARHRQGRRPRHRQEPRRHHPEQQRLHRGEPRASSSRSRRSCPPPRSTAPTPWACPGCWSSRRW